MPFNGILPSHANLVGLQKQMTQGETTVVVCVCMYYILDDDKRGGGNKKRGRGLQIWEGGLKFEGFEFLHR